MNKLAINFLLLSACSFSQSVYADCKPDSTITVPSLYYDLSADFSGSTSIVTKSDKTNFPGTFTCSSPGILLPNVIGIASPFNGRTAIIGFNGGKQFVEVTMTALGKDRITSIARGTHPASNLNTNFTLRFTLLKSKPSRNYTEVAGDTAVISPFILVSDASSMGILIWLTRIVLKLVQFLLTWQWPVDENDIFLQPITIKYNPIATTCDFSNKGLIVNLPMVSISDVKNIDRPGYQPFSLNFSCSDLLTGNKTTRNIAMFLASNNLHSTDKTVLINTTQLGAKGVGFRLVQGNKTSTPILFSSSESIQGNATSIFNIAADSALAPTFSINMGAYYYAYDLNNISAGKITSTAILVFSYD
ncbi:fimbrial protein [Arsenophonus apicola]|uniref:Fimbrial protein n=1 Tax=Arsenophonus apicola TaxID=2879119 RepID=A0ABY8P203_9GAMM|nr:fimbrial protein [Arsenophonus apicola]WGO83523.1 fimbrial protein [Arsenophonus apicola]